ncbi:hypothetical protein FLGE108171_14905 [Flavobacterium gelidilacus]|jgi:hypothetical protein|uniref:hypothetical protein n=1 Tax=Flavobacterium gelidilacus TaxID=206041 RepID=UPI000411B557|nr:hypothetical protein [Flavobacterium gelidilacus]
MKKSYFIFLVLFGIFLIPNNAIACGNGNDSCEKEITTTKTHERSCCENDSDEKGCEGSCGHSKCGCASTFTTSSTSIFNQLKFNTIFNFSTITKVNFHYTIPSLSEGYSSIWLIPKIS